MQKIPKIIHQTWIERDHPWIKECEQLWLDVNPDYEYRFYTDNDITSFIRDHFDDEVNECYSRINCGALRADFFRYCVLYIKGGIYADVDHTPDQGELLDEHWNSLDTKFYNTPRARLSDVILEEDECVFVAYPVWKAKEHEEHGNQDVVFNAVIMSVPGHPIFFEMIKQVCNNIKSNKYRGGNEIHLCCGTEVIKNAILKVTGCNTIPCHGYLTPHIKFLRVSSRRAGLFFFITIPDDMTVNYDYDFNILDSGAGVYITPETEVASRIFLRSQVHFEDKYSKHNDTKHKHYSHIEYTYI